MHVCTHPHFNTCEVVNVYAVGSAMACVGGASILGIREVKRVGGEDTTGGNMYPRAAGSPMNEEVFLIGFPDPHSLPQ